MNLAKKSKVIAAVLVAVTIVAVATTCIICLPRAYKGEDLVPTSTAYAPVQYSRDNTAVAFVQGTTENGDNSDCRIMFPTQIYLDRTENLSTAGYYFFGDFWWSSGAWIKPSSLNWWIYKSVFGKFDGSISGDYVGTSGIKTSDNEYTMSRIFSNYDVSVEKSENLNGGISEIYEGPGAKKNNNIAYKNYGFKVPLSHDKNGYVKFKMTGSVSSSVANGQYTFTSPDDNVGLFYQSYKSGSNEPGKSDIYRFTQNHTEGEINHKMTDGSGIDLPAGYKNPYLLTINITIYDKSTLNNAVNKFKEDLEKEEKASKKVEMQNNAESTEKELITK